MSEAALVGRSGELERLRGWLDAAVAGRARAVVVAGEAGVGKTRLIEELAEVAASAAIPVRWARATEGAAGAPYRPWHHLVGGDMSWPDPAGEGAAGGASPDAAAARTALFDEVTDTIRAQAEPAGMLAVIDDVHWLDPSSALLALHLVRHLRGSRALVVVTLRTSAATGEGWTSVGPLLLQEPLADRVDLAGLGVDSSAELLEHSGGRCADARDRARLHELTGGNPFFIRELGRAGYDGDGTAVPPSVLDVIVHRAAHLSERARRLVDAAAVAGDPFHLAVAVAMVDEVALECLPLVDECQTAGFLVRHRSPGEFRFGHGLVRQALLSNLPLAERVALHRRAALAIEAVHAANPDAVAAELAHHWAEVSVTGERTPAVDWAMRAARLARAAQAFEEAARLYARALDSGGPQMDMAARHDALLGLATCRWLAGDLNEARQAVDTLSASARAAGRPDLAASAVLVLECIGDDAWDRDVQERCHAALLEVDPGDTVVRVRLLARAAEAAAYGDDWISADADSTGALALAEASGDVVALVAALRARQLACSGPEHTELRRGLADRMIEIGTVVRDPLAEMWGRLWRIDTHWERGEIAGVAAEVSRLRWCVERVGTPMARWHLLLTEAALAQATARFDDAIRIGRQAFDIAVGINQFSAFGGFHSLLGAVAHHTGPERVGPMLAAAGGLPGPGEGQAGRPTIYDIAGPALEHLHAGRLDEARALYDQLGPVGGWDIEPYFEVSALTVGVLLAAALHRHDDLLALAARLERHRDRHVVVPVGNASYMGPVRLALGRIALALGHHVDAERELAAVVDRCRASGAVGFVVEAECLLAESLVAAGDPAARARGAQLAGRAEEAARRLGMEPWVARSAAVSAEAGASAAPAPSALSAREEEVARLVADGMTNREIAQALFLSERTAQNHVQHILTKLGFANRSQIASWVVSRARE